MSLTLKEIQEAQKRLNDHIFVTPLERSSELDHEGIPLYSKLETLQRTGSFKIRGALNKILLLSEAQKKRGVVAASMGNHAQGVALAAQMVGAPATIVMPKIAPLVKLERTRGYGATVEEVGSTIEECLDFAKRLADEKGFTFIHPYNDEEVIAGQWTIGLEILKQLPDVAEVIIPVGGGGLIAGVALALKETNPKIRVTGVRPSSPQTSIADGIRVGELGDRSLPLVKKYVDEIVEVDDLQIAKAVLDLMDKSKAVVEGAAAATLAAVETGRAGQKGKKTVLLLSGGNIDFTQISRILTRGLAQMGRIARIRVLVPDVPGKLAELLYIIKEEGANVLTIDHDRAFYLGPVNSTLVMVTLETRGKKHIETMMNRMKEKGYLPETI